MWKAVQGSGTVFINNKEAVRQGDQTKHCGGSGNMIEGSGNVMIGGAAGSGGGGGSGGGSSSGQAGGGTDGGAGSQTGTNSNQTGSGGGGGAPGAAGGGGGAGGAAAGAAEGGAAPEKQTSANPTKDPEKDSFALWLELAAVNGGKLIGEIIEIIDPDTKEVIATKEVGEDGNVFVEVPKNKPYDVQVQNTEHEPIVQENSDDLFHMNQLSIDIADEDGIPVASGTAVKVKGNGVNKTMKVGFGGHFVAILDPGTYELEVDGQTFVADTINGLESKHDGYEPYQFILPSKKKEKK
jgi:hypothetical protein